MDINERFRELREKCGKNQTEWAKLLGLSRSGVSEIESGRRSVTEKHIKLLSINPIDGKYINVDWLRTGVGEPFKKLSQQDEITKYVSDLLSDGTENPLYEIIIQIMKTYAELTPESQEILRDFSKRLMENMKHREEVLEKPSMAEEVQKAEEEYIKSRFHSVRKKDSSILNITEEGNESKSNLA